MTDPDRPTAAAWLESDSPQPALVVVGVPWDVGSGGARTPGAVRTALARFSTVHSESGADLDTLGVRDVGDWSVDSTDPETGSADIERRAAAFDPTGRYAFVGGDPAVTRPIVGGLGVSALGLLTLGSFHRVGPPDGPPNRATVSGLVHDGMAGEHITQVGVHGFANRAEELAFCDEQGISQFPMDTIDLWGIEETITVALDQLASRCERIYISFDMSVLDAVQAPGSPDSRPGGLSARQLANAAFQCGRHPQVVAADFIGVAVDDDPLGLTVTNLTGALLSFAAGLASRPAVEA